MPITYRPYKVKKILNASKRPDSWFWTSYSAYPYIGCQHGCLYCYSRERKYCQYADPDDFSRVIKVKSNAAERLRVELSRTSLGMVMTGDYQPAEFKFRLSRQMLQVCLDLAFPVYVLEKSHNVLQDMELLQAIKARTSAVVAFSIIATPQSSNYDLLKVFEPAVPRPHRRFRAMEQFAQAGIATGTALMPILPGLFDDDANLEAVVKWTADHGGTFVLAGALTLADQQKDYFFRQLHDICPQVVPLYQQLYPAQTYAPADQDYNAGIGLKVAELCEKYGIRDRQPRFIPAGDKCAVNKRIAEMLADKTYRLELAQAPLYKQWAYRKAWWAIDGFPQDIRLVYERMGLRGLESIKGVGPRIGREVEELLTRLDGV